jgi:tetratricopeptide (TPR) repeat protein
VLAARGQIVRKETLSSTVWGSKEALDESVSRTVYRLRVARHAAGGPEVVETVYNSGFRVTVPVRESKAKESYSLIAITRAQRPHAISALMSAREFMARRSPNDIEAAVGAAQLAIQFDPGFAAAWTLLAEIRIFQATRCLRPPREAGWIAQEAAHRALDIDANAFPALAIRGWALQAALETAQDLARRFATTDNAQGIASIVCAVNGLLGEATACGWKAMELAPHTPARHVPLAHAPAYLALGDREKAIALLKEASERGMPQFAWTRDDPRLDSLHGDPVVEQLWSTIWTGPKLAA